MITEQEYKEAIENQKSAEMVINAYHRQKSEAFDERWKRFEKGDGVFSDDELTYSAAARCKCGAGLAYPKDCGGFHQWTCADVLTGRRNDGGHEAYPFAFYEIKSENQPSAHGETTRPKS